ncbi:MAG: hypothetical protein NT045_00235 [Candidatus Aureabacteria bacterium]|nr:hypothetical protein [Candidatus Auribacterota bacterium]
MNRKGTTLLCTYCSARKRKRPTMLPAIRRYCSPRIRAIHRISLSRGASFAILSGTFGLLGPYQKIPYYDHLLQPGEIVALLPQMSGYLKRKGYRSVRFYHEPLRNFPQIKPYLRAIRLGCRRAGARLMLIETAPPWSS